jgi:hypothetical protein
MRVAVSAVLMALIIFPICARSGPQSANAGAAFNRIEISGASIEVNFESSKLDIPEADVIDWVERSARAVAAYYGRFPLKRVTINIQPRGGRGVHYGNAVAYRSGSASITAYVGRSTRKEDFDEDWVMTHEMIHLGFPSVPEAHSWIEEGLATYLEPLAKTRIGAKRPEDVWLEFVSRMPEGLPRYGDGGLDYSSGIGRVYWGGAIFWLLADVEIRQKTNNRRGLEDALRGILSAGGSMDKDWDINRTLNEGDKVIGVPVLRKLYERMGATRVEVDLQDLWKRLGIERRGNTILFNDRAPQASIRRAITRLSERGRQRSNR